MAFNEGLLILGVKSSPFSSIWTEGYVFHLYITGDKKKEGFKKNNPSKIIWVQSVYSQIPLENKCFQVLLGVKDEVSLMAWANKFYTPGFPTAALQLPPCLRQPRAISTGGGSATPGLEVLGNCPIPPGPMPLGTWTAAEQTSDQTPTP